MTSYEGTHRDRGDYNEDGIVDVTDLNILLGGWLNANTWNFNVTDLDILLTNWLKEYEDEPESMPEPEPEPMPEPEPEPEPQPEPEPEPEQQSMLEVTYPFVSGDQGLTDLKICIYQYITFGHTDNVAPSTIPEVIGDWDVSMMTTLAGAFRNNSYDYNGTDVDATLDTSNFNEDISAWQVSSSVTNLEYMFYGASAFNQPLDSWDTSNVTDMSYMFYEASAFSQNIASWNTSNVTNMSYMFYKALAFSFGLSSSSWNTSNVTDMSYMFYNASTFNQPVNSWDVSSVTTMRSMFGSSIFNQPLESWDVSSVTTMRSMFSYASAFNQSIESWNTSSVTDMRYMFTYASAFNQPIESWDVSNVIYTHYMFKGAEVFNQSLNDWNVFSVTKMEAMFHRAHAFNGNISDWDVSNVTTMTDMFASATAFNQDIGNWDVSSVTSLMRALSYASAFNQDIGGWDVSSVTSLAMMFYEASAFNQDLSGWCVTNHSSYPTDFSTNSSLSDTNYPVWGTCPELSPQPEPMPEPEPEFEPQPEPMPEPEPEFEPQPEPMPEPEPEFEPQPEPMPEPEPEFEPQPEPMPEPEPEFEPQPEPMPEPEPEFEPQPEPMPEPEPEPEPEAEAEDQLWIGDGLDIVGASQSDNLGHDVAINSDGDIMIISAYGGNYVRVYGQGHVDDLGIWDTNLGWTQLGTDIKDDDFSNARYGRGVSINAAGDIVAIGASRAENTASQTDAGLVQMFKRDENVEMGWTQLGSNILPETDAFVRAKGGYSVALNDAGNIVVIGYIAYEDWVEDWGENADVGAFRVFKYTDDNLSTNGEWEILGSLVSAIDALGSWVDGESDMDFGYSVDINGAGDIVAVGAPWSNDNGSLTIFQYVEDWERIGSILPTGNGDPSYQSMFGQSVALNNAGTIVAVGAPKWQEYDEQGPGQVHIYVYESDNWTQRDIFEGEEDTTNQFGANISLNGDGNIIAISTANASIVQTYQYVNATWTQFGGDITMVGSNVNNAKVSLNYDGNEIVIGNPSNYDRDNIRTGSTCSYTIGLSGSTYVWILN